MEYRQLGGAGLKIPVLTFGTATFGGGNEFFRTWGSTQADTDQIKRLDAVSETQSTYPYWHQQQKPGLNPMPKFY